MIKNFRTRAFLRIFLMSSSRKKNLGFSLLEMLIVLAMMAGMMAMVWPNLQRPLQRAALNDAVSTLRSVLDEARYQAMARGEIWLVRLEVGSQELAVGDFGCYLQLAELELNWRPPAHCLSAARYGLHRGRDLVERSDCKWFHRSGGRTDGSKSTSHGGAGGSPALSNGFLLTDTGQRAQQRCLDTTRGFNYRAVGLGGFS